MLATTIAIEGPDKVGKETQTKLLVEKLRKIGWKVKHVEMPVNDGITYRLIYWMLRKGYAKPYPKLFQFVQFLNKWFWQLVMPYFSHKYDYIVFDRWAASAVIYGRATGVPEGFNLFLYGRLVRPDLTVVLLGQSYRRKGPDDSYEADNELQARVRDEYEWWATVEPKAEPISNQGSREDVHRQIMSVMDERGLL